MATTSQNQDILNHLKAGQKLTPLGAFNLFGSLRLSARIFQLRNYGFNIKTTIINVNGKRVAEYSI